MMNVLSFVCPYHHRPHLVFGLSRCSMNELARISMFPPVRHLSHAFHPSITTSQPFFRRRVANSIALYNDIPRSSYTLLLFSDPRNGSRMRIDVLLSNGMLGCFPPLLGCPLDSEAI